MLVLITDVHRSMFMTDEKRLIKVAVVNEEFISAQDCFTNDYCTLKVGELGGWREVIPAADPVSVAT